MVLGGNNGTLAPSVWVKHRELATVWCAVRSVDDSCAIVFDAGRFNTSDVSQFALHDNPPVAERCSACVRVLDAERIAAGLAELATNAPGELFGFDMSEDE